MYPFSGFVKLLYAFVKDVNRRHPKLQLVFRSLTRYFFEKEKKVKGTS